MHAFYIRASFIILINITHVYPQAALFQPNQGEVRLSSLLVAKLDWFSNGKAYRIYNIYRRVPIQTTDPFINIHSLM